MLELTELNFLETIKGNDTVIVDFWAPWCGPCRQFAPIFEKVAANYDDVVFAKLNTEDVQSIAGAMEITSIPTIMAFRKGVIVYKEPGAMNATMLTKLVDKIREFDVDAAMAEEKGDQ